ncbi:MAG TPA: hypothetical protein QF564_28960 [Pirellulaceae bacterium]|nr:hypothetical protein [Pirellulaceae bacterium]
MTDCPVGGGKILRRLQVTNQTEAAAAQWTQNVRQRGIVDNFDWIVAMWAADVHRGGYSSVLMERH